MRSHLTRPKLATAWPIQYWENQLSDLCEIARGNEGRNINNLGRTGAAFLIRATKLNNGVVPDPSQVFIRRLLAKRAKRDSRKS